jgi:glycogenin
VLANKLGDGVTREIPTRALPYGSEGVLSTHVVQATGEEAVSDSTPQTVFEEPSYHGPSAAWEKGEGFPSQETPVPPTEEEKDVLET